LSSGACPAKAGSKEEYHPALRDKLRGGGFKDKNNSINPSSLKPACGRQGYLSLFKRETK